MEMRQLLFEQENKENPGDNVIFGLVFGKKLTSFGGPLKVFNGRVENLRTQQD